MANNQVNKLSKLRIDRMIMRGLDCNGNVPVVSYAVDFNAIDSVFLLDLTSIAGLKQCEMRND